MSNQTDFDKELDRHLKYLLIGDEEGYDELKYSIKHAVDKHVIGEALPVYGPENEAGNVSLDSYMNSAVNSRLADQREALWGNK